MKGIIVYKGKYGATHQYAQWLAEQLDLPTLSADNTVKRDISGNDFIIAGSSVYIGKLLIKNWLVNNQEVLRDKKIFLFVVCGTPAEEKEKLETYLKDSVPAGMRQQCQVYFLPGKLVYRKLSLGDKFMLRMGAMINRDPKVKKAMLTDYDDVRKENLGTILADINKFSITEARVV